MSAKFFLTSIKLRVLFHFTSLNKVFNELWHGTQSQRQAFLTRAWEMPSVTHMTETLFPLYPHDRNSLLSLHGGLGVVALSAPSQHLPFNHTQQQLCLTGFQGFIPPHSQLPSLMASHHQKGWWICCSVLIPSHNKIEQSPNKQQANKGRKEKSCLIHATVTE